VGGQRPRKTEISRPVLVLVLGLQARRIRGPLAGGALPRARLGGPRARDGLEKAPRDSNPAIRPNSGNSRQRLAFQVSMLPPGPGHDDTLKLRII